MHHGRGSTRRAWLAMLAGAVLLRPWRALAESPVTAAGDPVGAPGFVPGLLAGERLTYRLRWGLFTVGTAVLETSRTPNPAPGGRVDAWPVTFSVTSSGVAERLYRVRTTITTWLDHGATRSEGYRKRQDEGGRRREEQVEFDRESGVARYTNFGEPGPEVEVPDSVHDPLSILFAFRNPAMTIPAPGSEASLPVTDGRKRVDVVIRAERLRSVEVPAGKFVARKLLPDTRDLGGVFRKSKGASLELWLADDAHRTPILLRSSVKVGTFAGELVSVERPS